MKNTNKKPRTKAAVGCGFPLVVGSIIVILLLINSVVFSAFFKSALGAMDSRISEPLQYVCSVGAIFVEYWIYDTFAKFFRSRQP